MSDPELGQLIEEEFEKRFAQRVETAISWMTTAGAERGELDDDSFVSAQFTLDGVEYFIGRPTLNLDFAFELEIGALIYEDPPFTKESLNSMLQPVLETFPGEEDILFLENDEAGVWAVCRFEGSDFETESTFNSRVREFVAMAEAAHRAVH